MSGPPRRFVVSSDILRDLYQKHSMAEIAKMFGVGETIVHKRIHEYGITLDGVGKGGHRKEKGKIFSAEHRESMRRVRLGKRTGEQSPNWKGGLVEKTCEVCGKKFEVYPVRKDIARFCSTKCRGEWFGKSHQGPSNPRWQSERPPMEKICQQCGGVFTQKPTEAISTYRNRKFCSKECADKGGLRYHGTEHPNYSPTARRRSRGGDHRRWEIAVKSRDGGTCQMCGAKDIELHAHHIDSFKDHPKIRWDIENGITLCYRCHENVHGYSIEETAEGGFGRKPVVGVKGTRVTRRWEGSCANCGKYLSKRWSDAKGPGKIFCSFSCAAKYKWEHGILRNDAPSVELMCASCGKPVSRLASQLKEGRRVYCNKSCATRDRNRRGDFGRRKKV